MKKLIILISVFFIGCQYRDLSNISIVTMVSIQYEEEFIFTTFNVLPHIEGNQIDLISSGSDNLFDAVSYNQLMSTDELYFNHITTIIIDEYIFNNIDIVTEFINKYNINHEVALILVEDVENTVLYYKDINPIFTLATTVNNLNEKNLYYKDFITNNNFSIPYFSYNELPIFNGYKQIKK
ncbi:MAG: hypothetical protein R3Y21_03670 [Mycoplasmatota bacterium]